ncbi:MAG: hypothetical protein ACFBSC_15590 [Microcoleaceae cyanobacterium]
MKRVILVHHHIFKNAGTSLQYALKQYFKDQYYECELPNSQMVTTADLEQFIVEHPEARVISGHHICWPTPQGEDYRTQSIVLLRDPLARGESVYKFERKQQAETEGAVMAKEMDFAEYVRWRLDRTPTMLCNYQTYYCSQQEKGDRNRIPTEADLEVAMQNLQASAVVGTVERYEETLESANRRLEADYPGMALVYQYLNVTGKPEVPSQEQVQEKLRVMLGGEIVDELVEGNRLDQKLWQMADKILGERMVAA